MQFRVHEFSIDKSSDKEYTTHIIIEHCAININFAMVDKRDIYTKSFNKHYQKVHDIIIPIALGSHIFAYVIIRPVSKYKLISHNRSDNSIVLIFGQRYKLFIRLTDGSSINNTSIEISVKNKNDIIS